MIREFARRQACVHVNRLVDDTTELRLLARILAPRIGFFFLLLALRAEKRRLDGRKKKKPKKTDTRIQGQAASL